MLSSCSTLAIGFLASAVLAEPAQNLQPRVTARAASADVTACDSSYSALSSHLPSPSGKDLSSWLSAHQTRTAEVPDSITAGYCTYKRALSAFYVTSVVPYATKCSSLLEKSDQASLSSEIKDLTKVETWCTSVPSNPAARMPRETGLVGAGMLAAAGVVAAIL